MKTLPIALLAIASLSGCLDLLTGSQVADPCDDSYLDMGFDGETWPDLSHCPPVKILSHDSFGAFDTARGIFQNLTGGDAVLVQPGDTGSALNLAVTEKGKPQHHLIYGLDNAYLHIALEEGILAPYTPVTADRVMDSAIFFEDGAWPATPADQGWVGINWDPDGPGLQSNITSLSDVRANADTFVTQDPHTSSPGLGFMLITIGHYGEGEAYDWLDYWTDLMDGGVLVTSGWSDAYEQHFSGGYGIWYGGLADKAIVNSYTESPAVEYYFGTPEEDLSIALVAPKTTWHQVQTTAKLLGGGNDAVAEAWIEFTLTDDFQSLAFDNGVYPVVDTVDANTAYGDIDPEPGTFQPIDLDYAYVGENLQTWLDQWNQLCEEKNCA